jgi:hypothetical protein
MSCLTLLIAMLIIIASSMHCHIKKYNKKNIFKPEFTEDEIW